MNINYFMVEIELLIKIKNYIYFKQGINCYLYLNFYPVFHYKVK